MPGSATSSAHCWPRPLRADDGDKMALLAAVEAGCPDAVCLLLDSLSDSLPIFLDRGLYRPSDIFTAAAKGGSVQVMQLLFRECLDAAAAELARMQAVPAALQRATAADLQAEGPQGEQLRALQQAHEQQLGSEATHRLKAVVAAAGSGSADAELQATRLLTDWGPALQVAAEHGRVEMVRLLLPLLEPVTSGFRQYPTALTYQGGALNAAAKAGHAGVVQLLIRECERVLRKGCGDLAMWDAVMAGHTEVIKVLRASGINSPYTERMVAAERSSKQEAHPRPSDFPLPAAKKRR